MLATLGYPSIWSDQRAERSPSMRHAPSGVAIAATRASGHGEDLVSLTGGVVHDDQTGAWVGPPEAGRGIESKSKQDGARQ